jgi:3-deoxy-manno-octulosonate cytidylyltransferase (CMP-KDO synthetase)
VATDDQRIADVVRQLNTSVLMTDKNCATGTDRIFQATQKIEFDVVLNIQGDEPQIGADYIDPLAEAFLREPQLDMATLSHPLQVDDLDNPNAVKVIKNINNEAIYFSRFPIPYSRQKNPQVLSLNSQLACEKHIGIYGYSRHFLQKFCQAEQTQIEMAESLEQLRALYLGAKIKILSVKTPIQGVDTLEDLQKLETLFSHRR